MENAFFLLVKHQFQGVRDTSSLSGLQGPIDGDAVIVLINATST